MLALLQTDGLEAMCQRAETAMAKHMRRGVDTASVLVAGSMKRTTRHGDRTGNLRGTARTGPGKSRYGVEEGEAISGGANGVDYAKFVNDGTKHMAARKYAEAALEENTSAMEGIFADAMVDALIEAGFTL